MSDFSSNMKQIRPWSKSVLKRKQIKSQDDKIQQFLITAGIVFLNPRNKRNHCKLQVSLKKTKAKSLHFPVIQLGSHILIQELVSDGIFALRVFCHLNGFVAKL